MSSSSDHNIEAIYESVKEHYSKQQTNEANISNSCFLAKKPHTMIQKLLPLIPEKVNETFFGCGCPIPLGIKGLTVLDLGSGSGRDVFLASALVGEKGKVIGVDMTLKQIELAKSTTMEFVENAKKANLKVGTIEFHEGLIEELDSILPSESVDLVASNCVINLSPQKEKCLEQVYKVLKFGGEFVFSDIYSDRKLHPLARQQLTKLGSCIGTVFYTNDFLSVCRKLGFHVREVSRVELAASSQDLQQMIVGQAKFYSITYRLFKLKKLEMTEENYGHVVTYKGTLEGYPTIYKFDAELEFERNLPVNVSGNVASALEESEYLRRHFSILPNDREFHFGEFISNHKSQDARPIEKVIFQVPTSCSK
ncbi:hypothetical protein C9374_011254 [Naegleria lovaniensis]|uniref:Arsenite methyltransferase n=1 Tax=Naegleria lovaniensis TaxID=51637 RepID=A0AA88KRB2_NAELO|nr:uncharacterized protein C9374_011254 [Naegleria lovaniensis]KAG2392529.1 hypothetical protein C9374_011254 [Naegleria lovaniensis]